MTNPATSLPPGFRFHPTDEELILHYMRSRAASAPCPVSIIAEVDIYKYDPWELPAKALFGDREWYFFSPRDRKYPNGIRPNRAAASGYWKATGTDKPIQASVGKEHIGVKKALVFYKGRPPKGLKTSWIMHEYRLAETHSSNSYKPMKLRESSMRMDDWVLCRIYKKSNHLPSMEDPSLQNVDHQEHTIKLPKSSSLSEFLDEYSVMSHLFDEMPEMPGPEDGPFNGDPSARQPFTSSGGGNDIYLVQQLSQAGSPASMAGNYLKRQRTANEQSGGTLQPAKGWSDSHSFTSFADVLDSPQRSATSQSLFNQQLLLNSQLGLL